MRASYTDKAIGGIALGVSTLAGSTFASLAKQLRSSLSAISLLFVSEILTGFFVLFSFGVLPVIRSVRAIDRTHFKWMILMAFCSGVAGPLLWFSSLSYTTAINASLFGKTEMIFMLTLASILLREKITRAHVAAILSVLAGMVIISLRGLTEGISLHIGDVMVMISVLCYATGNITFRSKLHGIIEPHIALLTRSTVAVTTFFLLSPFIEHPFISELMLFPAALIPVLLIFAFVSHGIRSPTGDNSIARINSRYYWEHRVCILLSWRTSILVSLLWRCVYCPWKHFARAPGYSPHERAPRTAS